jgi:hypothetical protein
MKNLWHTGSIPLLTLFLVLVLAGCAAWPFRGEVRPVQEVRLPELMSRMDARTAGMESLKALLTMKLPGHQPITARLSWVRPHRLHFTGFNFLGSTLFEVIVGDGLVHWSEPGRPAVLLGTVESLQQQKPVGPQDLPITIEDLVIVSKVLTGPVLDEREYAVLEKTEPFYILHGVKLENSAAHLTKRLWIERKGLHLVREEFFGSDASPSLVIHLEEYRHTIKGNWPHRWVIEKPEKDISFEFIFREFNFNVPISPEEFRIIEGSTP